MKPYEREHLADPIMSLDRNPISSTYLDHVFETREGARGATGARRRRLRMQLRSTRRGGAPAASSGWRIRAAAALLLAGVTALAGVLPEDRADVMYHRYEGGGITVQGPSVLVRKKLGDHFAVNAQYYEDMISSASIDVMLSASPYKETRKQKSAGAEYLHGKTTYSVGFINSRSPTTRPTRSFYSISQDMFGDLTTVTLSYRRGWDQIFRDIKVNGTIINDPTFHQRADHRVYGVNISQILTRSLIGTLNYQFSTDQGYLASPYRLDPLRRSEQSGRLHARHPGLSQHPHHGCRLGVAEVLPAVSGGAHRASTASSPTPGASSRTRSSSDYVQPVWRHWTLDTNVRYYTQGAASFYSDLFPHANYPNYMARDRELADFHSITLGAEASYAFSIPRLTWIQRSIATLSFNRMMIHYLDYRDALYSKYDPGVFKAGAEPLYTLNANVIQAYVSIWY